MAAKSNGLGDFLRARREQVRPEDVGLAITTRRRVRGLRREELAMLAGISSDYYLRLEQGRDTHPSSQVLDVTRAGSSARCHSYGLPSSAGGIRRWPPT